MDGVPNKSIFYLGNGVNVKDMAGIDQDQEIEGEEGAAAVIEEEIDINPPSPPQSFAKMIAFKSQFVVN